MIEKPSNLAENSPFTVEVGLREAVKPFSFDTITDFDEHINKSIPNYDILISSILSISEYFLTKDCVVYDLGCSTGKLLKSLRCDCVKIGYDTSSLLPESDSGKKLFFSKVDLNGDFNVDNASLVYSIFTMQFLNPARRRAYLQSIYNGMVRGGALIIAEKVYQDNGKVQEIFSFSHYDYKIRNFSSEEIISKERDLRFIMKPETNKDLLAMLSDSGFSIIEEFWSSFNFKAILAIA